MEEDVAKQDDINVGYIPVNMVVETFENEHSILTSFPDGELNPQPFIQGSREKFEKTAESVKAKFGVVYPRIIDDWDKFLNEAPKNDDVWDYISENPLYVPFRRELFRISDKHPRYSKERGVATQEDAVATQQDVSGDDMVQRLDQEAAAKENAKENLEMWRSMPCMGKQTSQPYQKVRSTESTKGKKRLVPYHEEQHSEEDEDEEDDDYYDDSRWVASSEEGSDDDENGRWCTVRRAATVSTLLGCALPYVRKAIMSTGKSPLSGRIDAVMKNRTVENGSLHFKVVDSEGQLMEYVPCKKVMSRSKAKNNPYKVTY